MGYKRIQRVTRVYNGLLGVTRGHKRLQGLERVPIYIHD